MLVPMVMRNTVGVPPFLVVASLVAGAAVGGIVGALLAVPLMAAAVVLLERLQARDSPVLLESHGTIVTSADAPLDAVEGAIAETPSQAVSGRAR